MAFQIPTRRKAILIEENGGLDVLQYKDVAVPEIAADEILVKNRYTGVNFIETYFRTGLYPSTKPYILGREATGVVVSTGENVVDFKAGDKVAYLKAGSFSQYVSLKSSDKVLKLSPEASDDQLKLLAGSLLQGLTVLTFISEAYNVKKDDYILVHAAAGGCGQGFTQLISQRGAHVIATASTEEKLSIAKQLGAEYVINSRTEDIVFRVMEITKGKGVQASFDGIGKDTEEISLGCLARKGTFVSFGNASGAIPPFNITKLTSKNLKLLRPVLFGYVADKEEWDYYSSKLIGLLGSGKLKVDITEVFPLKDYKLAAEMLEGRKTTGKIVLEISDDGEPELAQQ